MVTPGELYNLQEENIQLKKELETAEAKLATFPDVAACRNVSTGNVRSITFARDGSFI